MRGGLLFLCAVAVCTAQVYRIEPVAGNGAPGYSGDRGPALRAAFNEPAGIALDTAGRIYVADRANRRIRRIESDGTVRTVAGSEEQDAAGFSVSDVAVDSAGTLYISGGSSIRAVSAAGTTSVLVSPEAGLQSVSAIAVEPAGTLIAGDNNRLLRITSSGSVAEVSTFAAAISGVAATPDGTVYVAAGSSLYSLRRGGSATPLGNIVPVSAGTRLFVDRMGDLYVSGARIWKIVGGTAYILAGLDTPGFGGDGGPSTQAQVNSPTGIAVDSAGNVFFSDTGNNRVRLLRAPFSGSIAAIYPTSRVTGIWPRNIILRWTSLSNAANYDLYFGTSPTSLPLLGTFTQAQALIAVANEQTTYYWQVKTRFAPLPAIDSPVFSFTTTLLTNSPPPLPELPSPPSFSAGQPLTLNLSWRGVSASRYEVYLGEDPVTNQRVGVTSEPKLLVQGLSPERLYYWRVIAINDAGQTISARWQFTTGTAQGYPWVIDTFAGTVLPNADGTVAADAVLNRPQDPIPDLGGNIFFIEGDRVVRRIGLDGRLATTWTSTSGSVVAIATDQSQNLFAATPEYVVRISRTGVRTFIAGQPSRRGYSGDNGAGTSALLDGISAIVSDRVGTLYVADTNNNRVRAIGSNGQIRTFAGNGTCGETDGTGAATAIPVCAPTQMAFDGSGNVFVYATGMILKITPDGVAERIAGTGIPGYSGDNGPARDAQVGTAGGLAADDRGNIYAVDAGAMTIRRIDASGTISTWAGDRDAEGRAFGFAGDGQPATRARFARPSGISVDLSGNLLIGDTDNQRIRRIDLSGFISTFAGSDTTRGEVGAARSAYLYGPTDVAVDGSGTVYIADSLNQRIRRVSQNRSIDTLAGGGADAVAGTVQGKNGRDLRLDFSGAGVVELDDAGNAVFSTARTTTDELLGVQPNGVIASAIDSRVPRVGGIARGLAGELYVSDPVNHRIFRFERSGSVNVIAGTGVGGFGGEGGPAALAQLNTPRAMIVSPEGELYVAELSRVRKITLDGRIVPVAFETAQGFTFDSLGYLYMSAGRSVYIVPGNGGLFRVAGTDNASTVADNTLALNAPLGDPRGLATTSGDEILVADAGLNRIFRLTRNVPSSLVIVSGNNQTSPNGMFANPLVVRVIGRSGLPVAGVSVSFSVVTSSIAPSFLGTVTTDGAGEARVTFNPGFQVGQYRVSAASPGLIPIEFQLQVTSGPATSSN